MPRWGKEKTAPLPAAVRDRRRSRHHPGGGDAGARDPVGISVRRIAARRARGAGRLRQPAAESAGRSRDRDRRRGVAVAIIATKAPMAITPAITIRWSSFPVFTVTAITMRQDPIYLSTYTARPPDEPSILGEALNEVFVPLITPAISRDRGFLAAAGRLLLSHRGGVR